MTDSKHQYPFVDHSCLDGSGYEAPSSADGDSSNTAPRPFAWEMGTPKSGALFPDRMPSQAQIFPPRPAPPAQIFPQAPDQTALFPRPSKD